MKKIQNEAIRRRIRDLKRMLRETKRGIALCYDSAEYKSARSAEDLRAVEMKFEIPVLEKIRLDTEARIHLLTGSDLMFSDDPADILSFLEYRNQRAIETLKSDFPDQVSEKTRKEIRDHFEIERSESAMMIATLKGDRKNA